MSSSKYQRRCPHYRAPREELASAARAVSELTHWEADNASACILWTVAIRHAILTGELDIARGPDLLPADDASRWAEIIDEALAPGAHPRDFRAQNGWVVRAFQGALAAVAGATSLDDAIERAIRGGNDTDTVAAIAGSLAGALWGGTAVPLSWKRKIHGWPGYNANDLVRQAALAARNGRTDGSGWPSRRWRNPMSAAPEPSSNTRPTRACCWVRSRRSTPCRSRLMRLCRSAGWVRSRCPRASRAFRCGLLISLTATRISTSRSPRPPT
ncbi:hypothetical protein GCM10009860_15390 [Microbacterium mitrae]